MSLFYSYAACADNVTAVETCPQQNDDAFVAGTTCDEALSALEAIDKYARSDMLVQRHCYIKGMAKAAKEAGYEASATVLLPLIRELSQDDDSDARQAVAEQLGPLGLLFSEEGSDAGYYDVLGVLEAVVTLLMDDVEEVQGAAEEALVALAPLLREDEREGSLADILQQLHEQEDEEELRMLCVRLIGDLAPIMGPTMCQRQTVPRLVELSQDAAFRVRKAVALCIPKLCKEARPDVMRDVLLPTFLRLSQDEIWSVRKACAESLGGLAEVVGAQVCEAQLVEVFENFANDVSHWVRTAAFQQLGPLIFRLGGQGATESVVGYFTSMSEPGGGGDSDLCMACAYNFPAVVVTLGWERWGELREAYLTLCGALQWKVRRALSCSLHELAAVLGPDITSTDLLPPFETFLKDLDEVRIGVVQNLAATLRVLPPHLRTAYLHVLPHLHTPGGENCANWRMRHAVASQLGPLGGLYEPEGVANFVLPVAVQLCRDPVAEVRSAAAGQLGAILRRVSEDAGALRGELADAYGRVREFAVAPAHVDRQMYVAICAELAGVLPPNTVVAEFLPLLLSLSGDPVANVRMPLAGALQGAVGTVQALAVLPDVRACLQDLRGDGDRDVRRAAGGAL